MCQKESEAGAEMNCRGNRWPQQSSSPLSPPSSGAPSPSRDKGNHLGLRAWGLTRRKHPKQKPAGTQTGHGSKLESPAAAQPTIQTKPATRRVLLLHHWEAQSRSHEEAHPSLDGITQLTTTPTPLLTRCFSIKKLPPHFQLYSSFEILGGACH